jgi:hypothetical protein
MPGTMAGSTAATCPALYGSPEQQKHAAEILGGGGAVGFALSEADHGSDLLASTVRLEPAADGRELTGEKWVVGLDRRCESLHLVARTDGRGPGAFTAVLLDLPTDVERRQDRSHLGNAGQRLRPPPLRSIPGPRRGVGGPRLAACLAHLPARAEETDPRREAGTLLPALDITRDPHTRDQPFCAHRQQRAPLPRSAADH